MIEAQCIKYPVKPGHRELLVDGYGAFETALESWNRPWPKEDS